MSATQKINRLLLIFAVAGLAPCLQAQPGHKTLILASPGDPSPDGLDTFGSSTNFAISDSAAAFRTYLVNAGALAVYSVTRSGTTEVVRVGTVIPNVGTVTGMAGNLRTNRSGETAVNVIIRDALGISREALPY